MYCANVLLIFNLIMTILLIEMRRSTRSENGLRLILFMALLLLLCVTVNAPYTTYNDSIVIQIL